MDPTYVREMLITAMRHRGQSLDEASRAMSRGLGIPIKGSPIGRAVEIIMAESEHAQLLDVPPVMRGTSYQRSLQSEARLSPWYTGVEPGDRYWPFYKGKLVEEGADYVDAVDQASRSVVSHLADPTIEGLKSKGMVVGYVQSGKTANYTAVIAKAADAGYRFFIVLAGLHNNLRRQTQERLESDLISGREWQKLTTDEADFGSVAGGAALMTSHLPVIAVVKKNAKRLDKLKQFLRSVDETTRRKCPIMILDDEADQATPNSLDLSTAGRERSAINVLIREIWSAIPSGSYVGYTATPFANVFMDPDDSAELYPSDFLIDLPRPETYFGAEKIFGKDVLDDAGEPDLGLDVVRTVSDAEADSLRPPSAKEEREVFNPPLPASLLAAIRWFLVATAIRRARGQFKHSSMLIHTTHYTQPHFAMRDSVKSFLHGLEVGDPEFHKSYLDEAPRAAEVASRPLPSWEEVEIELEDVLRCVSVVVDNGSSDERLTYHRTDENGEPVVETVIAIGGATLSRGLTLEGLVVSYFNRSSNTYDTLLQMGRWFGYRTGYEDLPRIWTTSDLAKDFRFLAAVEEEIRSDMRVMETASLTPQEFGVRVRAHPGRLQITSKMGVAKPVRMSFSGQRKQTFIFDETNREVLSSNLEAARDLVSEIDPSTFTEGRAAGVRWIAHDVDVDPVLHFFERYRFHEDQPTLNSALVSGWLRKAAVGTRWSVAVMGPGASTGRTKEGVDLGFREESPYVTRAPLSSQAVGTANIKALLSQSDWVADLDPEVVNERKEPDLGYESIRADLTKDGLLMIFPVDPHSKPRGAKSRTNARREMEAVEPVIGVGVVFPEVKDGAPRYEAFYSVRPDWSAITDDVELPEDTENSADLQFDSESELIR